MNELFEELEIQAIAYADSKVPAMDRYNDIYHTIVRRKFAELLIKECAWLVNENDVSLPYGTFGDLIKNHFGVEE